MGLWGGRRYQTKESITNLLGADKGNVGQCNGALTSAIRQQPKAVIILDEFEKADPSFQVTAASQPASQPGQPVSLESQPSQLAKPPACRNAGLVFLECVWGGWLHR